MPYRPYNNDVGDTFTMGCPACAPFACDDPDRHLGAPREYTPLKNRGCHCGADYDGRDCMCFEGGDEPDESGPPYGRD